MGVAAHSNRAMVFDKISIGAALNRSPRVRTRRSDGRAGGMGPNGE